MNFDVFGFGMAQNFRALLQMAAAEGVTDVRLLQQQLDVHLAVQRRPVKQRQYRTSAAGRVTARTMYRRMVSCQQCGAPAIAERVNVCPSTAIGGPWKSSISCTDPVCRHVELSELPVAEVHA